MNSLKIDLIKIALRTFDVLLNNPRAMKDNKELFEKTKNTLLSLLIEYFEEREKNDKI